MTVDKVSTNAVKGHQIKYNRSMKNIHQEHLEDNILNGGAGGALETVEFLKQFGNMLTGKNSELNITTKWDGAPSIVCGINPLNGRFFVGTKGVFNKTNPKICYDNTDVDRYYQANLLREKLKTCLKYLPELGISGVIQGDLLFTQEDRRYGTLGGTKVVSFQPNAITYAVDLKSKKGEQVINAALGIVFHTSYKGDVLEVMEIDLGNIPQIKGNDNIFVPSVNFVDEAGVANFGVRDAAKYTALINRASGSLKKSSQFLHIIHEYGTSKFIMAVLFKQFFNQRIRKGLGIVDTKRVASDFAQFYSTKMDEEIDTKKSEKGKQKYKDMKKNGLAFIAKYEQEIYFTVASYISIRTAKKMVIDQLNKVKHIKTFVDNVPSQPEGYVVSYKGSLLKFVDDEFRRANITVVKSWQP